MKIIKLLNNRLTTVFSRIKHLLFAKRESELFLHSISPDNHEASDEQINLYHEIKLHDERFIEGSEKGIRKGYFYKGKYYYDR